MTTAFLWEYVFPLTFWLSLLRPGNVTPDEKDGK